MQLEGRFAICNKAEEGPIPTSAEVETEEGLDSGPTGRMAFAPSPWQQRFARTTWSTRYYRRYEAGPDHRSGDGTGDQESQEKIATRSMLCCHHESTFSDIQI